MEQKLKRELLLSDKENSNLKREREQLIQEIDSLKLVSADQRSKINLLNNNLKCLQSEAMRTRVSVKNTSNYIWQKNH